MATFWAIPSQGDRFSAGFRDETMSHSWGKGKPNLSSEIGGRLNARQSILQVAKTLGLFRIGFAAQRRRNPFLILCYHGISQHDEHEWNPELYMAPELFERRIERLRDLGFNIESLSSALERLQEDGLSSPTVALTFDDGWFDFYSQAWPILRKYGAPATVYQTTFYSCFNRPVFDVACSYLLWRGRGRVLRDRFLTGVETPVLLTSSQIIRTIEQNLKERVAQLGYTAEEKHGVLLHLAEALQLNYAEVFRSRRLHLMNAAEIHEISRHGIDVQLHTHNHSLTRDKDTFLREIERNRFYIEMATGRRAVHFCYPNGHHRPEYGGWLQAAGVRTATTCDPGFVRRSSALMYLPRLTDSTRVSQLRFDSWLCGVGLAGARCKRFFSFGKVSDDAMDVTLDPQGLVQAAPHSADPEHEPVRARAAAGN